MKHVVLLVALFFAAHSAQGQTDTDPAAADTNAQQQVEYQPLYQQPHDVPPIPPAPPTPPPAATQERTGKASSSERWRYDPAARRGDGDQKPSNQSVIERALKGINPCNVNYGGLLAEWRIAEVQETIENIYYWALLFLCGGCILSTAYNAWLLHEREDRLQNTGAIIAQLSNAHIFARSKALEAIEAYKKLVEKIDAEDAAREEESAQVNSAVGSVVSRSADTTGTGPSEAPQPASSGEGPNILSGPFTPKPKAFSDVPDQNEDENNGVPLSVRAARWQETRQEGPAAKASISEETSEAEATPEALSQSDKDTEPSDAEDVDAIKLALQKAMDALAAKDAQIATKDTQLRAKDDKITSQRQLVNDLNNKLKANGASGSGAN